ncbi:MAG TPA: ATP-binding protein, partial [Rhodothermales bacterium]|nr:ATP-binding protein [Rhodothermales bacterium]
TYTKENGLPSVLIRDLYEDADGYLWIALEDRGLCRLDRRNGTSLQDAKLGCLDSRQGLYQSGLHRIIEDDQGRFWFNTNTGIFWVERAMLNNYFAGDISSVTSDSYTEADGMRNREGNGGMQPAGIKARDGRLWFPTQDGIVIIDPRDVSLTEAPPVVLETVKVGEELRRVEPSLTLRPEERDVAFRYTALEYNRPEDVRFQYKLEGYDGTWRDAGAERVAAYTNLPPGDYIFLVRAGLGGIWSDPASMEVTSTPFFWEATWFLVLTGLLFATVGPLFYVFRVRQLKAREAELEQAVAVRTEQLAEKATELQHANELKSRFLANLSHEFRTPLTLTFGPLDDIAHRRFASLEEAIPHVERARRNGGRLLLLINQLLDLSRLDAGALLLHTHRHDLATHLLQIAALFDSFAETRSIHFATDIPDGVLYHVYDADKMEKVVVNLLSNAFKFTPAGGKVSVSAASETDGSVRIVVADTGPGISEAHLGHLFDRFYQVDSASTRSHEGTGIGLALVKELVELHEGTIEVESTVGFGTRFTVRIPRLEEEAAAPRQDRGSASALPETEYALAASLPMPALSPELPASVPEEATVVLVVDDNADMRAYIRAHLEEHFTIIEAENGRVGFERAVELVPDLVLSDVMMPEMDGLEACAALKADERTSHTPVVLLTAKAEVEHRIEGYESGADAYLPKPFNAEEVQVRVRTLIAERQRLRARFAGMTGEVAIEDESTLLPREAAFLAKVEEMIETHLSDAHFGVDHLAEALSMSRRQLFRKMGALTEETPAALMRRRRLEQATVLLREGTMSVKEVAFEVGFTSQASFGRLFREVYGVPPSQYVETESKA